MMSTAEYVKAEIFGDAHHRLGVVEPTSMNNPVLGGWLEVQRVKELGLSRVIEQFDRPEDVTFINVR